MSTSRTGLRAALRASRDWWPELLTAALLTAIAFAGQKDDPLFAVFCAIIGGIFWAMGHRHRRLPMQRRVDGLTESVRGLVRDIRAEREPAAADGPTRLRVVRGKTGDPA